MNRYFVLVMSVLALLLAACQPIQPEGPSAAPAGGSAASTGGTELVGTQWLLTTINGEATLADVSVTALFDAEGNVGGTGGCNNYGGPYTVDGANLTIGPNLFSTMMACEDAIMAQEGAYLLALTSIATYAIEGETLTLSGADGAALLVFQVQSQGLGDVSLIVTGFNNGNQAVVSPLLDTEITINFAADGSVSGNAGCNNFMGSYTTDGNTIAIGPLATTRMMCEEEIMQQEMQFIAALESSATYSVRGTMFETRTADDAMAINAIPAE